MRGEINNEKLALKKRDFSKLRWGAITPTDIDGYIEFDNKLFVWFEGKYQGCRMCGGQLRAYNNLCDAVHDESKERYGVAFTVWHDGTDNFDYATAPVAEYRWRGQSIKPSAPLTLYDAINGFRRKCGIE